MSSLINGIKFLSQAVAFAPSKLYGMFTSPSAATQPQSTPQQSRVDQAAAAVKKSSKKRSHSSKEKSASKEPKLGPLTHFQAAIKIQRYFRNHLASTNHELINQSKNLMKIPGTVLSLDDAAKEKDAKKRWNKLQAFATKLKKDHYVFAHASSVAHSFFVDMQTHLHHSVQFPADSCRWDASRKLRPLLDRSYTTPTRFKNVDEYFQSTLCQRINSREEDDGYPNNALMLSCDGFLNNSDTYESSFDFF